VALTGGVLLAGGRSRRFGAEKAMAELAGRPLITAAAEALAPCEAVAVSTGAGSGAAAWARGRGLTVLEDRAGLPRHPLAGVLAGLDWAAARGFDLLATAPCDTPRLPGDLIDRLLGALSPDAGAVYAISPGGPHPLCALWRVSGRGEIAAALAAGEPPVLRVLTGLKATTACFEDDRAFANVNRPEDLTGLGG
jgi:molybdopterin-guanine dinucleotide biosynthesis protein A